MGVFKLNKQTTKCRIVYLSNLCQSNFNNITIFHNQAIHSGPCLNAKLSSSLIYLKFGKSLLIFDLQKAFNQLVLSDKDSAKLLTLWYKDVTNSDFSLICYKNVRLPFGFRCSPTLLMLALY